MGGMFAYLASEAATAVKRKATIYGLMAASALIVVFAAGYALSAVHALLMFRYGPIWASLIVAGALLVVAVISVVIAMVMSRRPASASRLAEHASPYSHAPFRAPYRRKRLVALAAGAAGALSAGASLIKFKALRNLLRGRR